METSLVGWTMAVPAEMICLGVKYATCFCQYTGRHVEEGCNTFSAGTFSRGLIGFGAFVTIGVPGVDDFTIVEGH